MLNARWIGRHCPDAFDTKRRVSLTGKHLCMRSISARNRRGVVAVTCSVYAEAKNFDQDLAVARDGNRDLTELEN